MFGNRRDPPKPPRSVPLILLALAVIIAVALTLGYYAVLVLVERVGEGL